VRTRPEQLPQSSVLHGDRAVAGPPVLCGAATPDEAFEALTDDGPSANVLPSLAVLLLRLTEIDGDGR
jgi:hypothetical protein